jgi:hypothetical protein
MSSGQPKACWINIEVGRYVMLDQYPYKPFEIAGISNEGEGYVRLEDSNTGASRSMTPKQFDAAGYVFAEEEEEASAHLQAYGHSFEQRKNREYAECLHCGRPV